MTGIAVLVLSEVSHTYPGRPPIAFPDCALEPGDVVALVGPSGSGKSTLLMLIAGLLQIQAGRIQVGETLITAARSAASDRQRSASIGMVLQSFQLLPRLTIVENLTAAQFLAGHRVDRSAALSTLDALGIAGLAHEKLDRLSRGQVQRASIARAVVNHPRLILADEPTSSLDDEAADSALDLLIGESRRRGAALLIATHDSRVKRHVPNVIALAKRPGA